MQQYQMDLQNRQLAFQQQQAEIANQQWQQQFDASQQEYQDSLSAQNREYAYNLAMTMLAAGVMPDTNTLNEAGISTADALNMRLAAMSTGGSGGGRGSSGRSSDVDVSNENEQGTVSSSGNLHKADRDTTIKNAVASGKLGGGGISPNEFNALGKSLAAQLASGNENVILCERGVRTFESYTRNTLDLQSIPVIKKLSHLPIIIDPSHAGGKWWLVEPMAKAAVAAGANGLMIEVHNNPEMALCDGSQSLKPAKYDALLKQVAEIAKVVGKTF